MKLKRDDAEAPDYQYYCPITVHLQPSSYNEISSPEISQSDIHISDNIQISLSIFKYPAIFKYRPEYSNILLKPMKKQI